MNRNILLWLTAILAGLLSLAEAHTPTLAELPRYDSITVNKITWKFSQPVRVGRFVNGDYYVVGPCTITAITPAPTANPARNGSVLNIDPGNEGTSFDDRSGNYFAGPRRYPPIPMNPGDALVSTISLSDSVITNTRTWLSPGKGSASPIGLAGVLTCVAAPPPTDAFRPGYCDRTQKIYCADSLRWNLLPNLPRVDSMTVAKLHEWSWHFYSSPLLDVCFFGFDAPIGYQVHYGREVGRAVGIGTLMLMCDFTKAEKESLMIGMVQYGVDLWGIVRGCNASRGWQAHGGHGNGRKWPMIFAGMMLGDDQMAAPTKTYPNLQIDEDMHTAYGPCWCSASNVVYTGHQGLWKGVPANSDPVWGPYEHLQPAQWPGDLGEGYRHCCTSVSYIGQALAALLMKARDRWDHPAFFDYCDRWMTESDTLAVKIIRQQRGSYYSADQTRTWDPIVNEMWKAYRNTVPSDKSKLPDQKSPHPGPLPSGEGE